METLAPAGGIASGQRTNENLGTFQYYGSPLTREANTTNLPIRTNEI
jgi:hypothetical protein